MGKKTLSVTVIYVLLIILSLVLKCFCPLNIFAAGEITWKLIGPGDADQVSSLSVNKDGAVFVGTDIGGIYHSSNHGESWQSMNSGIKCYDITTPILIDPKNNKNLYVGTRGGFYKSKDGGLTWEAVWNGIGSPQSEYLSACVGAITINPANSDILYLGIGYRPSSEGTTVVKKIDWSGNIYKSLDSGENWKFLSSLGGGVKIRHIAIDHKNTNVMYAATDMGLFKSIDTAKTWKNILDIGVKSIAIHPDNSDIVYLAAGSNGILKSGNGGISWENKNSGLSLVKAKTEVHTDNYTQVLIDSMNTETIYTISSTWGSGGGVYKTIDGGNTWNKITNWPGLMNYKSNIEVSWLTPSRRVNTIAIDSTNIKRIYVGTSRYIYRSDDGGNTWKQLISKEVSNGKWIHRGINVFGHTRIVGIDPNNQNRLYIGTADHGLVKSDDNGKSWSYSTKGMKYQDDVFDIVVDQKKSNIVYVINVKSLKIAGFAISYDFGETWTQRNNGLPDDTLFYTILLNPETNIIFIGGQDGIYKSVDEGKNWIKKSNGLPQNGTVYKLLYNHEENKSLYAALDDGLYKSNDIGDNWFKTHKTNMKIATLVIDPYNPKCIYAGVVRSKSNPGGVYKSVNGGNTWIQVLSVKRGIEAIAIVPTNPVAIYAVSNDQQYHDESCGEGIFRSVDNGKTWENIENGLPVQRGYNINIAPYPPYKIYLSTNGSGVFVTVDPNCL